MDDKANQNSCTAQEAVRALRKLGWLVYPHPDKTGTWQIGDAILSEDGLIKFAAWAPKSGRVGWVGAKQLPKPHSLDAHLKAIEALECIRAVAAVVTSSSVESEAAAFRLIQAILKKTR